jgi:hypothetical protein
MRIDQRVQILLFHGFLLVHINLYVKLDGISTVLYRQVLDLISRYNSYLVKMITIK